jgi:hypothetical protein
METGFKGRRETEMRKQDKGFRWMALLLPVSSRYVGGGGDHVTIFAHFSSGSQKSFIYTMTFSSIYVHFGEAVNIQTVGQPTCASTPILYGE